MSPKITHLLLLFVVVSSWPALADYGWIPDYEKLVLKGGYEYYSTTSNFGGSGEIEDITFKGNTIVVTDHKFMLDGEYGIAEDWSALARLGFIRGSAEADETVADGYGPADVKLGLKYGIKTSMPILTFESYLRIPATSVGVTDEDLVVGDGSFDLGATLHTGHKSGKFIFTLSPGVLLRFGGQSAAGLFDVTGQWNFPRGYVRAIGSGYYSFKQTPLFDSKLDVHDAPGSAGSYAKLAGSPVTFAAGARIGIKATPKFTMEAGGMFSVFGTRAPNFISISLYGIYTFDFFKPEPRKRIREIPLDSPESETYYN